VDAFLRLRRLTPGLAWREPDDAPSAGVARALGDSVAASLEGAAH
jgi:hypothetical protein